MGATAIRSTVAFPGLELVGVITSSREKAIGDIEGVCARAPTSSLLRCTPSTTLYDPGVGDRRVVIDGDPALTIVSRADVPGGTRADGGNATAANRLLGAIEWLATQKPGIYDGLDVPLRTQLPDAVAATRWAD